MAGFSFWQKWLWVVGVLIAAFGVLMALSSGTSPIHKAMVYSREVALETG